MGADMGQRDGARGIAGHHEDIGILYPDQVTQYPVDPVDQRHLFFNTVGKSGVVGCVGELAPGRQTPNFIEYTEAADAGVENQYPWRTSGGDGIGHARENQNGGRGFRYRPIWVDSPGIPMVMLRCVLCHAGPPRFYCRDDRRDYLECPNCGLVQVPARWHLSAIEEKAYYDLHRNDPFDEGYRRFLGRALDPVLEHLSPGARGLDFGSGPGPTLSRMFRERGFDCEDYDLHYARDERLLQQSYHFVTATEVVEHLANPREVLERLWGLLLPGGVLAIMTKRVIDAERFARWHYKSDPTHVTFFHTRSFEWLADHWGCCAEFHGGDVVLLAR